MRRFPTRQAGLWAGCAGGSVLLPSAPALGEAASSPLLQPRAVYSSQSSKATKSKSAAVPIAGGSAALAAAAAAAAAASTAATASPSDAAARPVGRSSKGTGAGARSRKSGAGTAPPPGQPPRKRQTAGRRRRAAPSTPTAAMRGRRASDPPLGRATTEQEAAQLLRTYAGGTAAELPAREAGVYGNDAIRAVEETRASLRTPAADAVTPSAESGSAGTAQLSTAALLQRLQLSGFVERVSARVRAWLTASAAWANPAVDPTLREWERQLTLSFRKGSFAECSAVQHAMQERYEDRFSSARDDAAFLALYARVLVNNAMFCLIPNETHRTVQLLTEAVRVTTEALTLRRRQQQAAEEASSSAPAASPRAKAAASTSRGGDAASAAIGDPECHLLLLRVLLANACAGCQQHWKAAEQYQLALSAMERNPMWCPAQVAPGLSSPFPVDPAFVCEDARLFFADTGRVDHAISQGRAQMLLLQSQGTAVSAAKLPQVQLAMARLYRHAGQYAESQDLYEAYLDGITEKMDGEDVGGAMLELGRLLLYKKRSEDAAVIYLEASSSILLEDAEALLQASEAAGGSTASAAESRIAAGNAAQRAAGSLVDAAVAFHALGKTGKAIGLLEGCLRLLDRAGLAVIGAWVRRQYADMLATVALVDRALEEYLRAVELLADGGGEAVAQLGAGGEVMAVHAAEVEGHLGFCLQTYVGDHKRAMRHYRRILKATYATRGAVTSAQTKLNKRARRQRAATAAAGSGSEGSLRFPATPLPRGALAVQPDVLHWVMGNYVACCERVGAYAEAMEVQNRLIEIEAALGGNVVESYLKLIILARHAGDVEKTLALCFYVFFLPDDMMSSETRLSVANSFAASCHQLGNSRMGSVLLQAVQQVRGDHDAKSLASYAVCLRTLDPAERVQLDGMMDIEAGIDAIGRVFRRAASIVVTDLVVDSVEEATMGDGKDAPWTRERLERALNGLIVLSRGAFFFHQNRFTKDAEELYAAALQHVDQIAGSAVALTEKCQREMSIALVNYATLKFASDPAMAAVLYARAAEISSTYLEVAEVVADAMVRAGDYAKGSTYIKRVIAANPTAAAEMHINLVRLGTGPAWLNLTRGEQMEVMEHLLKGLGVAPERVAAAFAAMTQRQLNAPAEAGNATVSLGELGPLLLDGVAAAKSEEAVCFTAFVVQTRFQEPRLLNRLYHRALLRFPHHATILNNYALLCMNSGYHVLARKYFAKGYAASAGDYNGTLCYVHYLARFFGDRQVGPGEAMYDRYLQQNPSAAAGHAAFANYMADLMPTPFKTEKHFKRAFELGPKSEDTLLHYGQFMWACADTKAVHTNDEVRRRVFDRAEELFKEAVAVNPTSVKACYQLGTFYANRQNRFEDAVAMLQRAHQLQPSNIDVVHHLLGALHAECVRLQKEEQQRSSAVAGQGSGTGAYSSRLRALVEATQSTFEHALRMDADDAATLERYARFAVETLQNPQLAATLYRRLSELQRK